MAAATQIEIESFIGKFAFLSSCGYAADLRFTSSNGNVKVYFEASLGCLNPLARTSKPSRIRRRQRRREKRTNTCNTAFNDSETGSTETSLSSETGQLVNDDLNSNFVVSHQQITETSERTSHVSDNCLVDATIQAEIVVQDVACQTEQELQSNHSLNSIAVNTAQPSPPYFKFAPVDANQCTYCDKEFGNWNDFLEYVKRFSFMCNGCLDYFPEKPWFSTLELVMIDVGSGDQLYPNVPHMTLP